MTAAGAYFGDAAIKERYLARVRAHRAADELIAGATGQGGKGCAVWCTFDAYEHARGPIEIGVPTELMELNDFIFESLPRGSEAQMGWPERFLAAPKPGADLRLVWDRFTLWILTEEHPDRGEHCARMGKLFERHVNGDTPTTEEWDQAARDAGAAGAAGAAWAAGAAGAAWAAWAARDARDAWDAWAAWAARDARDAWDARDARAARDARDAWAARAARAARDAWDARDARAARDARDAWAARAARAARAAWDARDAWAARAARDAWDARDNSISRMADKLIQLLSEAT